MPEVMRLLKRERRVTAETNIRISEVETLIGMLTDMAPMAVAKDDPLPHRKNHMDSDSGRMREMERT